MEVPSSYLPPPDAFLVLDSRNYKKIAQNILSDSDTVSGSSFGELMLALRGTNPVDVYALTAVSAIPLADTIRGYHDALNLPKPHIVPVNANSQIASNSEVVQADAIFMEGVRLGEQVRRKSAAIIDQWVGSGRTVNLGRAMLRCAGARGIRSHEDVRWYDQARPEEVDPQNMTSLHADFLHDLGLRAAQATLIRR